MMNCSMSMMLQQGKLNKSLIMPRKRLMPPRTGGMARKSSRMLEILKIKRLKHLKISTTELLIERKTWSNQNRLGKVRKMNWHKTRPLENKLRQFSITINPLIKKSKRLQVTSSNWTKGRQLLKVKSIRPSMLSSNSWLIKVRMTSTSRLVKNTLLMRTGRAIRRLVRTPRKPPSKSPRRGSHSKKSWRQHNTISNFPNLNLEKNTMQLRKP